MALPVLGAFMSGLLRSVAGAMARQAVFNPGAVGAGSRLGLAGMRLASGRGVSAFAAGALAQDFVTLGRAVSDMPSKLNAWGASLLEWQRTLMQVNGNIAAAFARLDASRFERNIRFAAATSGTTVMQARSQDQLEEALLPWKELGTNLKQQLAGSFQGAAAEVIQDLNSMLKPAVDWLESWFVAQEKQAAQQPLEQFARDIIDGKHGGQKFPPLPPLE